MATKGETPATVSVGQIFPVESSLEYRWDIQNYLSESQKSDRIVSPPFSVEDSSEATWNLELFPNGYNISNAGYLVILLQTSSVTPVNVKFTFSIIDGKKRLIHVHQSNASEVSCDRKTGAVMTKSALIIEREKEILTKGKLMILYEIKIVHDEQEKKPQLTNNCQHRLKQFDKYENLLNNKKFSDLAFIVEGKKLHAHKAIVTFGSTVFSAMLEHKMRESMSNTIIIDDAAYEVFKELLRFMYCGKVHHMNKIADQLFVIADKYELLELKEMCECNMCDNLKIENVVKFLELADQHRASRLRTDATNFVVTRAKELIDRPESNKILHLDEEITMNVMRGLVARQADAD